MWNRVWIVMGGLFGGMLTVLALAASQVACGASSQPASTQPSGPKPEALKDRVSYSIGVDIGQTLKDQAQYIELEQLIRGLRDAMNGQPLALSARERADTMMDFQRQQLAAQADKDKVEGDKNLKEGKTFLEENKKKDGVIATASGLQYKILKPGTGAKPRLTDTITCHYRGTLINGTEFDSSYNRGQPLTLPLANLIQGWIEAIQLMPIGSKWQLFIPPDLAYGPASKGAIPANSTLIFEIELLDAHP